MAEYPTRTCGPCPRLARFERVEDQLPEFAGNTVPETRVVLKECSGIPQEHNLGVTAAQLAPDLSVPPAEYKGGIPPCREMEREGGRCGGDAERCDASPQERGELTFPRSRPPVTVEGMHADAERRDALPATKEALRPVPEPYGAQPCYLPKPTDSYAKELDQEMGPIGPWATGRVEFAPQSGLTGTRPVVDKYSITRYGETDWRVHNKTVLDSCGTDLHRANLIEWNGRQCLEQTQADVDKDQEDNTKRLQQRAMEVHRWKCELERGIQASSEEIVFLEEQRHRLKRAGAVLTLPESISGECLSLRSSRLDSELVRDEVEEELIKETALCSEIRDLFSRTLADIEKQLEEDKTAKQKLEYDWSDKKTAYEIDSMNAALNLRSTVLMFKPGAVSFPEGQSTPEYWEHFTKETLLEAEAARQRSVALRGTLEAILTNASRDLRAQADRVEAALASRIACTQEAVARLERELKTTLGRLVDIERLIDDLKAAIHRMDVPMKKAQTRLDNRLQRPRVENCRDEPHYGLVEEVKSIGEGVAALKAQLSQTEASRNDLMKTRNALEHEIMLKKKTLQIDDLRTKKIRSYYPSATALTGY